MLDKVLMNVNNFNMEEKQNHPVNISNPDFFKKYNDFLSDESNMDILKQHTLWSLMLKLSLCCKEYEELKFDFYGKYMSGLKEMKPLWKRAVDYINSQLGELLGLEYCNKYFTEDSKNKCDTMVRYIVEELKERLTNNDWMDDMTKKQALVKLDKMRVKIGYPTKEGRRDLSSLKLDGKSFFENHCIMNRFDSLFNLNEIYTPKNKERFHMYPHMVNAYYSPVSNEIVFPAGILQWPFFNLNMDMSENFGAIGVVIGHEITHGFDDQGRKYDGDGNLNDWWSESVGEKYKVKTDKIRDLFDTFQVNGRNVNGSLTLGENIADLGGLSISYHAYMKYLKDYPSEDNVFDGFTSKQRFFLGFARVWCGHMRDEEMEKRIMTDPHSPAIFRVNGSLCNMQEFYDVFNVGENDKLYLDKSKRGSVW
jgi:predicted metalloendopeptidase